MLDVLQKRKLRAVLYHKYTLWLIFIVVLFSVHSTWVVYTKKRESELLMSSSKARLLELQTREKDLRDKIDKLNTEKGIEEEIRSKFSVTKENEKVVIVVPDKERGVSSSTESVGFWKKVLIFLGF